MSTREGMSSGGGFNNQLALTSRTMNSSTSSGDDHQEEQFQVPWVPLSRPPSSFMASFAD
ncbi:hypothetical protein QJS10_CPB12g00790 [Acorus calamus]|uniref:Uncharacterized protein n=1 Tax=Acorus calamus TaxID=4465 RepID=A0AAV9DQW5_ACOCL|nr:hypothetical protein QJS10_CPB12g00790 [Acorus calamus]